MQLALVIVGLVLVLAGIRDTYSDLAKTIRGDFVGKANFGYRAAAILMVGVIGYAGDDARKLSTGLMFLLTLGLLVTVDKSFFSQLKSGVAAKPATPTVSPAVAPDSGTVAPSGGSVTQGSQGTLTNALNKGSSAVNSAGNALKSILPIVAMMFA